MGEDSLKLLCSVSPMKELVLGVATIGWTGKDVYLMITTRARPELGHSVFTLHSWVTKSLI